MSVGQPLYFVDAKIDHQMQRRVSAGGMQDTDAARFDQSVDCGRRAQPDLVGTQDSIRLVIGDQRCPKGHERQRKARLAAARWSCDQKTPAGKRDCARMEADRRWHPVSDRQAHDKACAKRLGRDVGIGRADVFGPDHTAVGFNDLLRDRKPKA